jgi:cyclic lactone autoinducer peptide
MLRLLLATILAVAIGAGATACGGSTDQPKPSGGIPGY